MMMRSVALAAALVAASPAVSRPAEKLFWKTPHWSVYITDVRVTEGGNVFVQVRSTSQNMPRGEFELSCSADYPWIREAKDHEPTDLVDDMEIGGRPNNIATNPNYAPATALTMHAALWRAVCPYSWR